MSVTNTELSSCMCFFKELIFRCFNSFEMYRYAGLICSQIVQNVRKFTTERCAWNVSMCDIFFSERLQHNFVDKVACEKVGFKYFLCNMPCSGYSYWWLPR